METGYRCINCKKFTEKGNDVYIVQDINNINFPACSIKCAEKFKQKNIERLQNKIDEIKNKNIEIDKW